MPIMKQYTGFPRTKWTPCIERDDIKFRLGLNFVGISQ